MLHVRQCTTSTALCAATYSGVHGGDVSVRPISHYMCVQVLHCGLLDYT